MKTYQLNTITYGMSSALFLAIRGLFHIADVYDLLTGTDNLVDLQTKKKQITAIFSKYGLDLAKWNSNCKAAIENSASEVELKTNQDESQSLGYGMET